MFGCNLNGYMEAFYLENTGSYNLDIKDYLLFFECQMNYYSNCLKIVLMKVYDNPIDNKGNRVAF